MVLSRVSERVPAAQRAALDDLHLVAALDGLGQALADIAAAGDDDPLVAVVEPAHLAHYRADMGLGGDEEDFVVGLDHRVALGNDRPVAAVIAATRVSTFGMCSRNWRSSCPYQRAAVVGLDADQLRLAFGEVDHLQRAGMFDQALDVVGDHLLRTDQHVHRDRLVVEQAGTGQVGRLADAGDLWSGY